MNRPSHEPKWTGAFKEASHQSVINGVDTGLVPTFFWGGQWPPGQRDGISKSAGSIPMGVWCDFKGANRL